MVPRKCPAPLVYLFEEAKMEVKDTDLLVNTSSAVTFVISLRVVNYRKKATPAVSCLRMRTMASELR
jgi:hypothetical protein